MTAKPQQPPPAASAPDTIETVVSLDPDSGLSNKKRRRLLLRRFWQSAGGFWSGSHDVGPGC